MVLVLAIGHGKRRVILHLIDGTILFDLLLKRHHHNKTILVL
jgi:hypothetical protein